MAFAWIFITSTSSYSHFSYYFVTDKDYGRFSFSPQRQGQISLSQTDLRYYTDPQTAILWYFSQSYLPFSCRNLSNPLHFDSTFSQVGKLSKSTSLKYQCFITSLISALSSIDFLFIFSIKSLNSQENNSLHKDISVSSVFLNTMNSDPPVNGGAPTFMKQNTPLNEYMSDFFYDALLWIHSGAMQFGVPTQCSKGFLPLRPLPAPLMSGRLRSLAVPKSINLILLFESSNMFYGFRSLWTISQSLWIIETALTKWDAQYLKITSEKNPKVLACYQSSPFSGHSI